MFLSKVQRLLSRRNGFSGVELCRGEKFPTSDRELRELAGFLSGVEAIVHSGFQERMDSLISLRNGFADAREDMLHAVFRFSAK